MLDGMVTFEFRLKIVFSEQPYPARISYVTFFKFQSVTFDFQFGTV